MFEMDKCREEFQKAFPIPAHWIEFDEKANRYYCPYVADATASTYQSKWVVWQHQQAKVEELQHRNQMLNDNIKEQGQKLVYQNEVIEKQAEKLLGLRDEKAELQKQVDAALKKLDKRRDELWSKWKWQADMQDQGAANAFEEAYWILEQALKGEGQ